MKKTLKLLGHLSGLGVTGDGKSATIHLEFKNRYIEKTEREKTYERDADELHRILLANISMDTYDKLHDLIHHHYCLKHSQRC